MSIDRLRDPLNQSSEFAQILVPTVNTKVQALIEQRAEMHGVTEEMLRFYREQPLGLLDDPATRRIVKRAYGHKRQNPDITTVLEFSGEGGGVGKTTRASRVLAEVNYDPKFIVPFFEETDHMPEAPYVAMTIAGQNMQKERDESGQFLVDKTAPNWTAAHLPRLRNRVEEVVSVASTTSRFQEMNKEKRPDEKVATLLVFEDLTGFAARRPFTVNRNHFGVYVLTNPEGQQAASKQREKNEDPSAQLGDIYKSNGEVVMDKPTLKGTDALDYMGNDASRERAFNRMNDILMDPEVQDYIINTRGVRTYNYADLRDDLRFRNSVVLKVFYDMRIKERGFARGQAAIADNPFRPGLPYNLHLVREFAMNTTEFKNWMPKAA